MNTVEEAGEYFRSPHSGRVSQSHCKPSHDGILFLITSRRVYQREKPTRTVPFRVQDVTFRRQDGTVIPNTAPLAQLRVAHSVTLFLENQKNGERKKS
jgi:hypothetical protein